MKVNRFYHWHLLPHCQSVLCSTRSRQDGPTSRSVLQFLGRPCFAGTDASRKAAVRLASCSTLEDAEHTRHRGKFRGESMIAGDTDDLLIAKTTWTSTLKAGGTVFPMAEPGF